MADPDTLRRCIAMLQLLLGVLLALQDPVFARVPVLGIVHGVLLPGGVP